MFYHLLLPTKSMPQPLSFPLLSGETCLRSCLWFNVSPDDEHGSSQVSGISPATGCLLCKIPNKENLWQDCMTGLWRPFQPSSECVITAWAVSLQSQKEHFHFTQVPITLGSGYSRDETGTETCTFSFERWSLKDELRLTAGGLKLPAGPVTMVLYLLAARGWAGFFLVIFFSQSRVRRLLRMFPAKRKTPNTVVSCRSFTDIHKCERKAKQNSCLRRFMPTCV